MFKKILLILIVAVILAAGVYFLFFNKKPSTPIVDIDIDSPTFTPIDRTGNHPASNNNSSSTPSETNQPVSSQQTSSLKHLSLSPVGGFMASTTPTGALVRFVDRGAGHIYEAADNSDAVIKISNTTIPRIYESYWNKNLTAFVLRYAKEITGEIVNFYGEIRSIKEATSTNEISHEVKGRFLSSNIIELAVSPSGDHVFTLNSENNKGVGYTSGLDESKKTRIFETPLTQVNVEWPEENTIALTTKGSGASSGYLYFFDIKKNVMKKVLDRTLGLSAKTSSDAKKILFSSGRTNTLTTFIYNTKDATNQEVIFKTLADKCVWSKLHTNDVYCAVPTELPQALYPDDWYKGNISFTDQIWHLDAATGEVHLIANLLNLSNQLIDATNLALDPKENVLYFINKRDLTLWSLDLDL